MCRDVINFEEAGIQKKGKKKEEISSAYILVWYNVL